VFTCDGARHAVEVTELHQYLDVQGQEESRAKFDEAVRAICEHCEKELGSTLDRTILVAISSPVTDGQLKSLQDCILSYARSGNRDKEYLFGRDDCSIESMSAGSPVICPFVIPASSSRIPGTQTITADIQARTDYALDRILSAKLPRLKAVKGFSEKVLIIWPEDPYCKVKHVERSLRNSQKAVEVRTILTKLLFVHRFHVRRFPDLPDISDSEGPCLEEVQW
jgi:hypothetical protein